MGSSDYLPGREADLLAWGQNVKTLLTASTTAYETYGLTSAQSEEFQAALTPFDENYALCQSGDTRTPSNIAAKRLSQSAFIGVARRLMQIVQCSPVVTDVQRRALRITVRKSPAPVPAPTTSPVIEVVSTAGRTVTLSLREAGSTKRAKPYNARSAMIYTFAGETPPVTDITQWFNQGVWTKTTATISFDASATGGPVWITANWVGTRGETSAACAPICVMLPAQAAMPKASEMKIAA